MKNKTSSWNDFGWWLFIIFGILAFIGGLRLHLVGCEYGTYVLTVSCSLVAVFGVTLEYIRWRAKK